MRRLYILPKDIHDRMLPLYPSQITTHWLALTPSSSPADLHNWKAAGCPVVVSTDLVGEANQDLYELDPAVTVLPHPVWHRDTPISAARQLPENLKTVSQGQIATQTPLMPGQNLGTLLSVTHADWGSSQEGEEKVEMRDGIDHLVAAGFGIEPTHTVAQVHAALAAVHPGFRLRTPR